MDDESPLYFVIVDGRVIVPADVYSPWEVYLAMVDCERVFGLPAVGVINSSVISALRGKAELTLIAEPGLVLRAEVAPP